MTMAQAQQTLSNDDGSAPRDGTTREPELSDFLMSRKKIDFMTSPLTAFCIDDFLPTELFNTLRASYPDDRYETVENLGGKTSFSRTHKESSIDKMFEEHPIWRKVEAIIGSQEFLDDVQKTFSKHLVRARGPLALRHWHAVSDDNDTSYGLTEVPIKTRFEFSILRNGAFLFPHSDKPSKLISFVYYFAPDDWQSEWGGGTSFYRPKQMRYRKNWFNFKLPEDALDEVKTFDYKPNRLIGFIKSGSSWHSVKPVNCPEGVTRRTFNFNLSFPVPFCRRLPFRIVHGLNRRSEVFLFSPYRDVNSGRYK